MGRKRNPSRSCGSFGSSERLTRAATRRCRSRGHERGSHHRDIPCRVAFMTPVTLNPGLADGGSSSPDSRVEYQRQSVRVVVRRRLNLRRLRAQDVPSGDVRSISFQRRLLPAYRTSSTATTSTSICSGHANDSAESWIGALHRMAPPMLTWLTAA